MITQNRGTIAFAVCGSFCTLEAALQSARALTAQGWQLLPVMSFAARQDTRFGTGNYWKEQLEAAAGHPVLDTLQAVEPLGPRKMAQALGVAPCTGATLSRLAAGLSDTPVTLAAKSLLRVGCPVVLAVSTNDGLGASGENIARLFQRMRSLECDFRTANTSRVPSTAQMVAEVTARKTLFFRALNPFSFSVNSST